MTRKNGVGGSVTHSVYSGVTDYVAENEEHACRLCRDILYHSHLSADSQAQHTNYTEPLYDIRELSGIIPYNLKKTFDMRAVYTQNKQ